MRVTVFGGAKPKPGEPAYEQAYRLGKQLAQAGHTLLTGGYIGTMEAASRGAAEAGGHVIGVTCDEIENWRKVKANAWVMEEMRFPTIRARLMALMDNCDAAIALPGGAGTLAEIAVLWNHIITTAMPAKPLILVGEGWQMTFQAYFQALGEYLTERDRRWLLFAPDEQAGLDILNGWSPNA